MALTRVGLWRRIAEFARSADGPVALDYVAAVASIGCLTALVLLGMPPMRTSDFAATDFKTLYASVVCLLHQRNAYSFAELEGVFRSNAVTLPPTWYGHAPVYPPITLALLAPFALLGMVPAAWLEIAGSGALLALAVAVMLRYAAAELRLAAGWRLVVAGLCAAPQILSFALCVGNVSVAASALCLLAFFFDRRRAVRGSLWLNAAMLAVALLLKPHLALWPAVAMLLLPERALRSIALRAAGIAAAFSVAVAGLLALSGTLGLQVQSFLGMLHAESAGSSSMSVMSHEVLPLVAQIPSVKSLLAPWIASTRLQTMLSACVLLVMLVILVQVTWRLHSASSKVLGFAGWCAFGLLATYHRAHDALTLLGLLPWIFTSISRRARIWTAWALLLLCGLLTCGLEGETLKAVLAGLGDDSPRAFLLLHQAALADLGIVLLILTTLVRGVRHGGPESQPEFANAQ